MDDAERLQRIAAKVLAEMRHPDPAWHWLSFIDPDRPVGSRFLGVAVVHADGPLLAMQKSHDLGINPGGEVALLRLPDGYEVPPEYADRLLGKDEAAQLPKIT